MIFLNFQSCKALNYLKLNVLCIYDQEKKISVNLSFNLDFEISKKIGNLLEF